jgi:hypothetical protein
MLKQGKYHAKKGSARCSGNTDPGERPLAHNREDETQHILRRYYLIRVGFSLTNAPQPPFFDFLEPEDEAAAAGVLAW